MTERMPQIDKLIQQNVSISVQKLIKDNIVSITKAKVSKDLSYAKIWVASISDLELVVKTCQENAPEIQKELAEKLVLRRMPKLHFVADYTSEQASHIESLINQIKKEK